MKARKWFFALGQSHEARGMPMALTRSVLKLDALPYWAKCAYLRGRMSVPTVKPSWARQSDDVRYALDFLAVTTRKMVKVLAIPLHLLAGNDDAFTVPGLERRLRQLDPEATASLGAEVNSVDVLTTVDPRIVQDMVPLGVKVNQRYRGSVPMVRIEDLLELEKRGNAGTHEAMQ